MSSSFEPHGAIGRWARDALGLADPFTHDDARKAFLRRIADEAFVPEESLLAAWHLLADAPLATADTHQYVLLSQFRDAALLEEVAGFADRFFFYEPQARREKWSDLHARCGCQPAVTAWLNRLRTAIDIDAAACCATDDVTMLIELILQLVMLPPAECAVSRQRALQGFSGEASRWALAARTLRKDYRQVADCETRLVEHLVSRPRHSLQRRLMLAHASRARRTRCAVQWCREHAAHLAIAVSVLIGIPTGIMLEIGKVHNPTNQTWNSPKQSGPSQAELDSQILRMRRMAQEADDERRHTGLPPDPKLEVGEALRRLFNLESAAPASAPKE